MVSLGTCQVTSEIEANVLHALRSNRWTGGEFVYCFEDKLSELVGVEHAIAVANGTLADLVALMAWKRLIGTTRVCVPALTFIAQINAIVAAGMQPRFVDVDRETMQISEHDIYKRGIDSNELIFPVHLLGRSAKLSGTNYIIDACEAFGGVDENGKYLGTEGIAGTYSFYPSHTMTSGEGGAIVTNDSEFAEACLEIRNHGRSINAPITEKFSFKHPGINAKMTEFCAAILCASIDKVSEVIQKRRRAVTILNEMIGGKWEAESPHAYPILYSTEWNRDRALKTFEENGIECRKLFGNVAETDWPKRFAQSGFTQARYLAEHGLIVPCHQDVTDSELGKIGEVANETLENK